MKSINIVIVGLISFSGYMLLGADFRIRNNTTKALQIMTHKNDGTQNTFQVAADATHELATPASLAKLEIKESGAEFLNPWQTVNLSQATAKFKECGPIEVKVNEKAGMEKGIVFVMSCQK